MARREPRTSRATARADIRDCRAGRSWVLLLPSDAVAAPLSCGAGPPARRSSRGYPVTLNECRGESWRGHGDASRSTTLAHLGQYVGADLGDVYPPRWLPARLEHVLIHP